MSFPSDLEIARAATAKPLPEIASQMGIGEHLLEPYGSSLAKISLDAIEELSRSSEGQVRRRHGDHADAARRGQDHDHRRPRPGDEAHRQASVIALRQPSMGPTFGIKGGAAGGGYSQVIPMELLNLHLTGDFHADHGRPQPAVGDARQPPPPGQRARPRPRTTSPGGECSTSTTGRCATSSIGLGGKEDGVVRQTGFDITAASEVMAILALATSLEDLRVRLGRIVVGYTKTGEPVTAEQLQGAGSMAVIMRDAIKPNLLQTLENTPVIVHAGPFGNIAHGNSRSSAT